MVINEVLYFFYKEKKCNITLKFVSRIIYTYARCYINILNIELINYKSKILNLLSGFKKYQYQYDRRELWF